MIYVKNHGKILAACDAKLIGKNIGSLNIKESFYKGKLAEKEEFHRELLNADNINLVGEKTIAWASEQIELDIDEENSIPYAIVFKV